MTDDDERLRGSWRTDPVDPWSLREYGDVSLRFDSGRKLTYTAHLPNKEHIMRLTYRVDGSCLVTDQPSSPRAERTEFFFRPGNSQWAKPRPRECHLHNRCAMSRRGNWSSLRAFIVIASFGTGHGQSDVWPSIRHSPAMQRGGDTVLAVSGGDTVLLNSNHVVVWTESTIGRRVERFRSGTFVEGATPLVALRDLNGDGRVDLFLSLDYEEQKSATVRLGGTGPSDAPAYLSPTGLCRAPTVEASSDGQVLIVESWPGAASIEDCVRAGPNERCLAAFPLDWKRFLSLDARAGKFNFYPTRVRARYSALASEYRRAAVDIREHRQAAKAAHCSDTLVGQLVALAARAASVAANEK